MQARQVSNCQDPKKVLLSELLLDPIIHLDVLVEGGDTMHAQRGHNVHVLGNVHSLADQDQAFGDILSIS